MRNFIEIFELMNKCSIKWRSSCLSPFLNRRSIPTYSGIFRGTNLDLKEFRNVQALKAAAAANAILTSLRSVNLLKFGAIFLNLLKITYIVNARNVLNINQTHYHDHLFTSLLC